MIPMMTRLMRKILITLLLSLSLVSAFPQRSADYGVSLGMSTYLGEINPVDLFYNPGPAAQFFYRYNLNPRQALRANLLGAWLSASDYDFINQIQQSRGSSFSGLLGELGATYEFNFFPYSTMKSRITDYTPYLAAGVALSVFDAGNFSVFPSIPFSAGVKVNIANQVGLEFEYGFRKTFYDNFDGLTDMVDPGDRSWMHNNDWYTFMGVSVTWKMYNKLAGCPAFADAAKDKKRKK